MEYVIYLSKSKIDMLYDQIHRTKGKVKAEGAVSLGVVSARIEKESKGELNYYEKLERVTEHIQDSIGSITDSTIQSYISGEFPFVWRVPNTSPQLSYWVGEMEENTLRVYCLLIGSSKNLLGASDNVGFLPYGNMVCLMETYKDILEKETERGRRRRESIMPKFYSDIPRLIYDTYCMENEMKSEKATYRFLAKSLYHMEYEEDNGVNRFIVASPLYVSCN